MFRNLKLMLGYANIKDVCFDNIFWKRFTIIALLGLVSTLLSLAGPYYIKYVIDVALPNKDLNNMAIYGAIALAAIPAVALVSYISAKLSFKVREAIALDIFNKNIQRLFKVTYHQSTNTNFNYNLRTVENSINIVCEFITSNTLNSVMSILQIIVLLSYIFYTSVTFGFVVIACFTLYTWSMIYQNTKMLPINERMQTNYSNFGQVLYGIFGNFLAVKEANKAPHFSKKIEHAFIQQRQAIVHGGLTAHILASISYAIISLAGVLFIAIGGFYASTGALSIGQLVSAQLVLFMVFDPLGELIENHRNGQDLQPALDNLDMIHSLEQEKDDSDLSAGFDFFSEANTKLQLENIYYQYPNHNTNTLEQASMSCNSGDWVSISGENGAGKSTIVSLLKKYFEPTSGTIKINDIDIAELPNNEIRESICLLSKDVSFFDGPIGYNLFFKEQLTEQEQTTAISRLKELELLQDESMYEHLLDKNINNGDVNLSSGQCQKIALVKASIRAPKVLVIDEGISAIDVNALTKVQRFIKTYFANSVVILISHRKDELTFCNKHMQLVNKNLISSEFQYSAESA